MKAVTSWGHGPCQPNILALKLRLFSQVFTFSHVFTFGVGTNVIDMDTYQKKWMAMPSGAPHHDTSTVIEPTKSKCATLFNNETVTYLKCDSCMRACKNTIEKECFLFSSKNLTGGKIAHIPRRRKRGCSLDKSWRTFKAKQNNKHWQKFCARPAVFWRIKDASAANKQVDFSRQLDTTSIVCHILPRLYACCLYACCPKRSWIKNAECMVSSKMLNLCTCKHRPAEQKLR